MLRNSIQATEIEALLSKGLQISNEASDVEDYYQAQLLLETAYQLAKEEETRLAKAMQTSAGVNNTKQKLQKKEMGRLRMDAACFRGANFLAQHCYAEAEKMYQEAGLYADLIFKDEGMKATCTFHQALCAKFLANEVDNSVACVFTTRKLLDLFYSALEQLHLLVQDQRESYRKFLALACFHLVHALPNTLKDEAPALIDLAVSLFNALEMSEELALAHQFSAALFLKKQDYKNASAHLQKAGMLFKELGLVLPYEEAQDALLACTKHLKSKKSEDVKKPSRSDSASYKTDPLKLTIYEKRAQRDIHLHLGHLKTLTRKLKQCYGDPSLQNALSEAKMEKAEGLNKSPQSATLHKSQSGHFLTRPVTAARQNSLLRSYSLESFYPLAKAGIKKHRI